MAVNAEKDFVEGRPEMLQAPEGGHRPFDGQAHALEVPGEVNVQQLIDEVYDHLGGREAHQVVFTDDGAGNQHLHVLGDVDQEAVRQVIASHAPDVDHGLDEQQRGARALYEKLIGGQDLELGEMNTLLRAMLR